VRPEGLADVRDTLEELGSGYPDALQVLSDQIGQGHRLEGHAVLRDARVGVLGELALRVLPPGEDLDHVGLKVPVAEIVGPVLVQGDAAALQVDVRPPEGRHLVDAHTLPERRLRA
jgi:hypothetical protein